MLNAISLWGLFGALLGAVIMGAGTLAMRFFALDQNWFLLRMRYWLILIGVVIGFVIGSTSQVTRAQLTEATEYLDRGDISYTRGDYASAIADYNQAIQLNPQSDKAYYGRGLAEYSRGDRRGALADFTQSIALNADDMNATMIVECCSNPHCDSTTS